MLLLKDLVFRLIHANNERYLLPNILKYKFIYGKLGRKYLTCHDIKLCRLLIQPPLLQRNSSLFRLHGCTGWLKSFESKNERMCIF